MNGLTAMNEVTNRTWRAQRAALVLAVFFFLLALTAPARAQGGGGAGKVSMNDLHFASSVGVARGQMLRITVVIPNNQDQNGKLLVGTDQGVWMSQVKVFDALTGAEIASFEHRNPTAGLHTFDIGGNGRDILLGGAGSDAGSGRVQLRIEVKLVVCYDPKRSQPSPGVYPPTFEVVDNESGRTTVQGGLTKVGPGTLVLANANTYD
jgi:hypothetical protein